MLDTTGHANDNTRPYDDGMEAALQRDLLQHGGIDLQKRMADEAAARRRTNPRFFEEQTVPVLAETDVIAGDELSKQIAEDITFLHPRDVHLAEDSDLGQQSQHSVDMTGHTELAPADVISTIENQISRVESEPGITVTYEEDLAHELLPEIMASMDIPVEEFLKKEKIEVADAYRLYEIILRDPQNPDIIAFTRKIAPSPLDFEIFWQNLELLSAQFIQAVLATGSYQESELDMETGKQKTYVFYSGTTLKTGGMGHVFYARMADTQNPKLRLVLIKVPLEKALTMPPTDSELAFVDEEERARQFAKLGREKADDPRLKNLLMPLYRGHGFLVMPIIKNTEGETHDLRHMAEDPKISTQRWAACLAGAVRGAIMASENGFIDGDLKPVNIMEGQNGGVLIDWGGFIDTSAFDRGEIAILTNENSGNLYPLVENPLKTRFSEQRWELNNGNVQRSPSYTSLHLLAQEISGQMPPGTTHKFSFYRVLEKYFEIRKSVSANRDGFMKKSELEKLVHPVLDMPVHRLNPAEQLLYDLYLKLHKAHRHPYRFRDNNPNHGLDEDYISMEEVAVRLDEIAKITI